MINDIQKQLISEIQKASLELTSSELIYEFIWLFDWPGHSLSISGCMLHTKYAIPKTYDLRDLKKLEEMGFLEKTYESEKDPITLEKVIKYRIL